LSKVGNADRVEEDNPDWSDYLDGKDLSIRGSGENDENEGIYEAYVGEPSDRLRFGLPGCQEELEKVLFTQISGDAIHERLGETHGSVHKKLGKKSRILPESDHSGGRV